MTRRLTSPHLFPALYGGLLLVAYTSHTRSSCDSHPNSASASLLLVSRVACCCALEVLGVPRSSSVSVALVKLRFDGKHDLQ